MGERLRLLTPRQELLVQLMKSRTVREIASVGVVSEETVRTQVGPLPADAA